MDSNSNSTGLIDSHYFGVALVAARMSRGISQSRLGILAACNVTSLRKIEKGMVQPGVSTAIRLVAATGESVGAFFQKLAEDSALSSLHGTAAPGSSCASPHEDDAAERTCDGTLMDRSGRKGRAGKNVCSVGNGDPQKVKALSARCSGKYASGMASPRRLSPTPLNTTSAICSTWKRGVRSRASWSLWRWYALRDAMCAGSSAPWLDSPRSPAHTFPRQTTLGRDAFRGSLLSIIVLKICQDFV